MSSSDDDGQSGPNTPAQELKAYMDLLRQGPLPDLDGERLEASGATESISEGLLGEHGELEQVHEAMFDRADPASLTPDAVEDYEALIVPRLRPVLDIQGDTLSEPSLPMWSWLVDRAEVRERILTAAASVGRIEVVGHPTLNYVGTAFVVGPGLILTNRHVAEHFVDGAGRGLPFRRGRREVRIDFKRELGSHATDRAQVRDVLWIHPFWDAALLRLDGELDRPALELDATLTASAITDRSLIVIGYPARDTRNDTKVQDELFRHRYGVKRAQPGIGKGPQRTRSYERRIPTVGHDASTLGGNSGSAVVDLATGRVVGLHFAGRQRQVNHAVCARDLIRDPQVGAGLAAHGTAADPDPDEQRVSALGARAWVDLGSTESISDSPEVQESGPPAPPTTGSTAASSRSEHHESPAQWYARHDDATLAQLLIEDEPRTRERIRQALPPAEAEEALFLLGSEQTELEGLEAARPDPDLPEILFLHGIMGSHLADDLRNGRRVWLDLRAFVSTAIAKAITLREDGITDQAPVRLRPSGHLDLKYRRAARRFRAARHVVHEFSYDWRKPLERSAAVLHHTIERRLIERPDARFVVVAHSMGGLVAATYASQHPEWASRIERAVLVGSPLGGSFAPLRAIQGDYPFFRTLAWAALWDTPQDLQQASATLPGLITMLPDPDLIPSAKLAYDRDLYSTQAQPSQLWLTRSRAAKAQLRSSPLLSRTRAIVCADIDTACHAELVEGRARALTEDGRGDGTVPLACAAIPELEDRVWAVSTVQHDNMLTDSGVIQGVLDLLKAEPTTELPRLTELESLEGLAEAPRRAGFQPQVLESAEALALRERIRGDQATVADLRWLMDPASPVPQ